MDIGAGISIGGGVSLTPPAISAGLQAFYDPADPVSYPGTGTTIFDLSVAGNNATMGAVPPTWQNTYFDFSGVTNCNYTNSAVQNTVWTEPWTLEAWIYVPAAATWGNGFRGSLIGRGGTLGSHGMLRTTTDNQLSTWVRGATNSGETYTTITRDAWYQVVSSWDGVGTVKAYSNARLTGSSSIVPDGTPDTGVWVIGGSAATFSGSPGANFQGRIGVVRMYGTVLSDADVKQNYWSTAYKYGL